MQSLMIVDYSHAIDLILKKLNQRPDAYLTAIAGIPGSGKTTLSEQLHRQLPNSVVLPMDGYHLPRSRLDEEGMRRRGARHTFDASTFRFDLENLKRQREGSFPAFDHAKKDPEPNTIHVSAETAIVIVEGLYLLMPEWNLEKLFDLTIYIDCDLETAMRRVVNRHLQCGLADNLQQARDRVESNDRLNALDVMNGRCDEQADVVLKFHE